MDKRLRKVGINPLGPWSLSRQLALQLQSRLDDLSKRVCARINFRSKSRAYFFLRAHSREALTSAGLVMVTAPHAATPPAMNPKTAEGFLVMPNAVVGGEVETAMAVVEAGTGRDEVDMC